MFLAVINLVTLFLVVLGALNWGLVAFGINAVEMLARAVGVPSLAVFIYLTIASAALVHLISRDYWLPFLGQTAYPCGSLTTKTPDGADAAVTVRVAANANVVFWAADGAKTDGDVMKNPWHAYSEFSNAGVAKADASGAVVLSVRKPASYRVPPFGAIKKAHVHYRTCDGKGMLGGVKSAQL